MQIKESSIYTSFVNLMNDMNYAKDDITKILWYSLSDHEYHHFTHDWFYSLLRSIDDYSTKKLLDFTVYLQDGAKITHKNYSPFEVIECPSILWDYHPAEFTTNSTFKIPHSLLK